MLINRMRTIRCYIKSNLSKGEMPTFSFDDWIIIYAILNAFLKIFDIFLNNVHLEYEISEVLKDFKNGLRKV